MAYFDKIKKSEQTTIKTKITWRPVIPADVGEPDFPKSFVKGSVPKTGDPNLYTYRNEEGKTCFYITRVEKDRQQKMFLPMSLFERSDNGSFQWRPNAWAENRPLFREELVNRSDKPVLILEGEKAVKFAESIPFINDKYIPMCFSGGAKAVQNTSFAALKNVSVVLFPDNDEPGISAMHEVAKRLISEEITDKISWIHYNDKSFPDKWDIADPIPSGHTVESIFSKIIKYEETDFEDHWKDIEKKWDELKIKELIEELKKNYCWIESLDAFYSYSRFDWVDGKVLNKKFLHKTKNSEVMDKRLLKDPEFNKVIAYCTNPGWKPGVLELKENQFLDYPAGKYLNNFRPSTVVATHGVRTEDCGKVLDYFKWFFGEEGWIIVEQFTALLVQAPGEKCFWTIFIQSLQGGGKNLFAKVIQAILGKQNVLSNAKAHQLTEKHSEMIQGKQVIFLNELSFSGSNKDKVTLTNELKDLFTEDEMFINPKGKREVRIANFCNFFILTNDKRAVKLDNTDRRYAVIRIKHSREELQKRLDEEGVAELILDLCENAPGALLSYFQNVKLNDIKYFKRPAPRTSEFKEMVQDTQQDINSFLDDAFEAKTFPFNNDYSEDKWGKFTGNGYSGLIIKDELYSKITKEKKLYCNYQLLDDWLKDKCIKWKNGEYTKQILLQNGQRPRAYLLENSKGEEGKELIDMTETELGRHHTLNGYLPQGATSAAIAFDVDDYLREKNFKSLDHVSFIQTIMSEFKDKGVELTHDEAKVIYKSRTKKKLEEEHREKWKEIDLRNAKELVEKNSVKKQ